MNNPELASNQAPLECLMGGKLSTLIQLSIIKKRCGNDDAILWILVQEFQIR